jgi:tetratricopeptide (TPR) repeat protein
MDLIRARILSRRGLVPESLSLYRELRDRHPGDREIWIDYIETLVNEGFREAARGELNRYLERHPGDPRASRVRARLLFEQGHFEAAFPVYDGLLEKLPEDAGIWSDYGYALQETGDWAGALDCFSRALELDPGNGDVLRSLHGILRDHLPRLDGGVRFYRQEEGDADWTTWYLRYERHVTERAWWTFAYDRIRMERPEQPFLPAVDETVHDASVRVAYTFNRLLTGRAGAGLFSGMGGGTGLFLGLEARPIRGLALRADYAHARPWYDPMEAVTREGREHPLVVSVDWSGWDPWYLYVEAKQSDYEIRDLEEYGRRRGVLGVLSRRFGENPLLLLSYTYARTRFEYESETLRPVLLIEREHVHGLSALFEHRPCTYWTYRLYGGVRRDTARDLDAWFARPEVRVRLGNRVEGRFSYEHSSEAGNVIGGTTRTFEAGLRVLF